MAGRFTMFPAYLYAAAIADPDAPPSDAPAPAVEKKLFASPFQVTADREWFEDRELSQPYQAPAHAPAPKSAEDRVALLEREVARKDDALAELKNENALFRAQLDKIAAATGVKFDDTEADGENDDDDLTPAQRRAKARAADRAAAAANA